MMVRLGPNCVCVGGRELKILGKEEWDLKQIWVLEHQSWNQLAQGECRDREIQDKALSCKTPENVTEEWQSYQNVFLALHNEYLGKTYLKIMKLPILHLAKAYEIFK